MCGRYTGYIDDCEDLKSIYIDTQNRYPGSILKSGEILPSDTAPVLVAYKNTIYPVPARWGFPGCSQKASNIIINARSETAESKPSFAESFLKRRCAVPTTGFYEWSRAGDKYLFNHSTDNSLLFLSGLFTNRDGALRFVILTTAANESVSGIHNRMPLLLQREQIAPWLCDTNFSRELMRSEMPPLIMQAV